MDILRFLFIIRCAIGMENVVKPDRRLARICLVPGIPWINRLGFAGYETPVESTDVLLHEPTQNWIECASHWSGHILSADNRTVITPEVSHAFLNVFQFAVAMEGNNVR